jgi:hypothetical protein
LRDLAGDGHPLEAAVGVANDHHTVIEPLDAERSTTYVCDLLGRAGPVHAYDSTVIQSCDG